MPTIKTFIRKQPLLIYFALVFALSWGPWILITGGAPMRSDPRFMIIVLAGPIAPALAGLLMTGLTAGRAGSAWVSCGAPGTPHPFRGRTASRARCLCCSCSLNFSRGYRRTAC